MYSISKIWKNILTLIFVLLLLTDGAVWVHHADHASAAVVSRKAVTGSGQGGSFTSGTAHNTGSSTTATHVNGNALIRSQVQSQSTANTTPAPSGYWPFDDGSGTTAHDSSSNNDTGTITGATWATGQVNGALSFNGTSNYVSMGTPAALKFGVGSFTVMSWFKTTGTTMGRMVGTGVNNYSTGFNLSTNLLNTCSAGCVGAELGGGSQPNLISFGTTATTFNNGNWHQAAMVIDQTANTAQLYVDGVAQALTTQGSTCGTASGTSVNITACTIANATNSTDPFTVGAYHSSGGTTSYPFPGSIDEVRVYNSALSSTQIQNQYAIDTMPSPAGYWHFDEDTGTIAHDSSANAITGTLTSGPTWTSGEINSGLNFGTTNKYVTMGTIATNPSTSALQFGAGSFTVMNWFKTISTANLNRSVSEGDSGWSTGYLTSVSPYPAGCLGCAGGSVGGGTQAASALFYTTSKFNDGIWHQEAMVVNQAAKTIQVYIDGVAQALTTQPSTCGTASGTSVNITSCSSLSASNASQPFTVGNYSGLGEYFQGSLDEVRIYGSALSSSQVQVLYTNDVDTLSEYAANPTPFSGTVGGTANYTLPISLTYQLSPAPGWNISITSTTLTSGSNLLPTTASTITSVTGSCTVNGTCSSNSLTNTISGFPITLPAATTAPTAVKFFGTNVGTGQGAYTVTPTFLVTIPATTKPGSYTSTITLTTLAGP